ncbi:MAG: hypothetical protein J3Q66DRAFT_390521 [Benniella sp.]|nr:MAG: hypothetical protein J3Q66DRAFT_390521 [Benniella sp.]
MTMIRTGLYSLSAAVAFTSNVFLLSLLVLPDPEPAHDHLWSKSMRESHGHHNLRHPKDSRFQLHPFLAAGAARFRRRILDSTLPYHDAALMDQTQLEDVDYFSIGVDIENHSRENHFLGPDTDDILSAPRRMNNYPSDSIHGNSFPCGVQGTTEFGALHRTGTFTQVTQDLHQETTHAPVITQTRSLPPHRGLRLDTSRDSISMAALYRTINMTNNIYPQSFSSSQLGEEPEHENKGTPPWDGSLSMNFWWTLGSLWRDPQRTASTLNPFIGFTNVERNVMDSDASLWTQSTDDTNFNTRLCLHTADVNLD